jgi:hypothetical protein
MCASDTLNIGCGGVKSHRGDNCHMHFQAPYASAASGQGGLDGGRVVEQLGGVAAG